MSPWLTLLFVALASAFGSASTRAQVFADTARGLVGKEVQLALRVDEPVDSADSISLRGSFLLSNPTVFFPERFVAGSRTTIRAFELMRVNDSVYQFNVVVALNDRRLSIDDTLCLLAGEALAGYDTISAVRFTGLRANDGPATNATGTIITTSVGTPAPYIRHATLQQGYPNPARRYQTVTWAFRIDKESDVIFAIYNLTGQRISHRELGTLPPGIYTETFNVEFDVPTGTYPVELTTNTGIARGWMNVVK
ncbi:MAG: T9SS type A sorting domain-containing protein [bacterium]|nr:T9SS type A sorting domain-containing protein [Candidatus Kapabacteria bacterium]